MASRPFSLARLLLFFARVLASSLLLIYTFPLCASCRCRVGVLDIPTACLLLLGPKYTIPRRQRRRRRQHETVVPCSRVLAHKSGFGNGSGAGLYIDFDGVVTFKGASFFLNNEVTEGEDSGGGGAALYSRSSMPDPMIFSGPVTVSGNSGMVGLSTPGVRAAVESNTSLQLIVDVCPSACAK